MFRLGPRGVPVFGTEMAHAEPLEPDPGHAGEGTESLAYSRISIVMIGEIDR